MKIYILYVTYHYSSAYVKGVYSKRELAEAAGEAHLKGRDNTSVQIVEETLDQPVA